ncbi:MAG: hypothetical protein M1820_005446 [Bogoriella megaspora]|nr:MAG: hypothetical protein M1820_005446 [Bogoriella megaspora]
MGNVKESRRKALLAVQTAIEAGETWRHTRDSKVQHFDSNFCKSYRLIDADATGMAEFEFEVLDEYANFSDNLHGGAAATIFDILTSVAIATVARPGYWDFGDHVSRSISVSYLRPAPAGETVRVRCQVMSLGKTMAMIRAELRSKESGKVYCTMEHHKCRIGGEDGKGEVWMELREEFQRRAEGKIKALL